LRAPEIRAVADHNQHPGAASPEVAVAKLE
jgi:hypothetical protein